MRGLKIEDDGTHARALRSSSQCLHRWSLPNVWNFDVNVSGSTMAAVGMSSAFDFLLHLFCSGGLI